MSTINLSDAAIRLAEIIAGLHPGEQIDIVRDGTPIATLTKSGRTSWPCQAGFAQDTEHWMSPDFDAPLEDFREYME